MSVLRTTSMLLLALGSSACVSAPKDSGFQEVEELSAARVQHELRWRTGRAEDERADAEVERLLRSPLTVDAALQIALLENRMLQAEYERLGIARANLVQAGLLSNPVLSGSVGFPDRAPRRASLGFGVVQNLLDLLLQPARKQIAEAQFTETKLSVAAAVSEFAGELQRAYFTAVAAEQVAALRRLVVDAAQASAELAERLHEAGNISALQFTNEVGMYERTRIAWARADAQRLEAREALTRRMGLWGERIHWTLPEGLPPIAPVEVDLEHVESRAVEGRLDLAAARQQSEILAQALGVARDWRFLMAADLGVRADRDTDGQWVIGPELSLELPVFDQGQARLARLDSELRRSDQRVMALAVEIRSEVRAARDRLVALRQLVEHYRTVVIPLSESIVALTQQEYNFMLVGTFELIAARQAEYDSYQEYLEAIRDYWITRSDLERAMGGSLGVPNDSSQPALELREAPAAIDHQHEMHGEH